MSNWSDEMELPESLAEFRSAGDLLFLQCSKYTIYCSNTPLFPNADNKPCWLLPSITTHTHTRQLRDILCEIFTVLYDWNLYLTQ